MYWAVSAVLSGGMEQGLYFLPLPQGQGSLGPTFLPLLRMGCFLMTAAGVPVAEVSLATFSRLTSCAGLICTRKIRRMVSSRMAVIMAWNIS